MPELPEVETIRGQLEPQLVGRAIVSSTAHWSPKFATAPDAVGAAIERVDRRGKYLLFGLDDGRDIVVHLGMTGSLSIRDGDPADDRDDDPVDDPFVRATWTLDDGRRLVYRDVRRFGRIAVVAPDQRSIMPTLAALGPEPFDDEFTGDALWASLGRSRRAVKTQLLSQRPVAGVGNIYADEALWLAEVHPAERRLARVRAARLRDAIRAVLREGLDHGGTTLRDYVDAEGSTGSNQHHLRCYGRAGEPCERCGDLLRRSVIDGRGTTWCPTCQRRR
jgi:formamidopyrimidine-DNA glycosylase